MGLTKDQVRRAHIAFHRFGLGAKPEGIQRIGKDAKAHVLAELDNPNIAPINAPGLPSYEQACQLIHGDFDLEHALGSVDSWDSQII